MVFYVWRCRRKFKAIGRARKLCRSRWDYVEMSSHRLVITTSDLSAAILDNRLFGARILMIISYTIWVIADFLTKFTNIVTVATSLGLAKIWMTPFDHQTPKPPVWCKILGTILNASWVMVIFVLKFPIFRYHCKKALSDTTVKLTDPKNPYLVQESWWYRLQKLSNGQFCLHITSACCHGNKCWSNRNWNNTADCTTQKTPCLVQSSCTYL